MYKIRKYRNQILLAAFLICIAGITIYASVYSPQMKNSACIELMRKVPAGYQDFEFWDAGTLRDNRDLTAMYEIWRERRGGYRDIISGDDIVYWAAGGVLTMVTGDLSLRDIGDKLSNDYYRDASYPDFEVWILKPERQDHGLIGTFVLEDGLVVWGNRFNIEDYLGVVADDRPSFCKDDVAEIVERLPAGIMIRASVTTVTGLGSITAMSVELEEKGVYRWSSVTRFLDIDAIANNLSELYMDSLEGDFRRAEEIYTERNEPSPFRDFAIERNGPDVTWSILVDEEEMIALLFYG